MDFPTDVCSFISLQNALFQVLGRISTTGASEYKLNGKTVTYAAYNAALISHNILVKAKNFLVFQGDVEAVASQSPRELTRLIEQISGSLELAAEYEKAKEGQERATENATFNFTKRRGIFGEIKQYKEQKTEADRFEALCQEKVRRKHFLASQSSKLDSSGRPCPRTHPHEALPH